MKLINDLKQEQRSFIKFSTHKERVALVYPFFAHYRASILATLQTSECFDFIFYGDTHDPADSGVKACDGIANKFNFVKTPTLMLFKRVLLQKGLISLALRKDVSHIIYLGSPYYITTWISAALARLAGKKVFFWTHGWLDREHSLKGWITKLFFRLSHAMLLYGQRAKAIGIENGFDPDSLYVIYNSLNYSKQKELRNKISFADIKCVREELFNDPHHPLVVFVGRLTKRTKLELLLDASVHLRERGHLLNILLIGDGSERLALQSYAKKLKLPVNFYGACYDDTILARLILAANVVVVPGSIGLTAIHSLSYGIPVISHNNVEQQGPEVEAITPGLSGDLFEQGSSADLARVLRKWTQSEFVNDSAHQKCFEIVDRYYNPQYQRKIIEQALSGKPASIPCD